MLVRGDQGGAPPRASCGSAPSASGRTLPNDMTLVPGDPLAHRALDSLLRAEASVRRRLTADLEREGVSATGFSVLVVLTTAGGELELRTLRARLQTSKANATEVVTTLESRGLVASAQRLQRDRRAASVAVTRPRAGSSWSGSSRSTPAGWRTRSRCSTRPRSARWRRSAASSPQSDAAEPATVRLRHVPTPHALRRRLRRRPLRLRLRHRQARRRRPTTDDTPAQTTPATTTPPRHAPGEAPVRADGDQAEVEVVATGLEVPWDVAFLPDGGALVTERPGRVRLIDADGELQDEPVGGGRRLRRGRGGPHGHRARPRVRGRRGVRLHGRRDRRRASRCSAGRWEDGRMEREAVVLDGIAHAGQPHAGALRFGPDGEPLRADRRRPGRRSAPRTAPPSRARSCA